MCAFPTSCMALSMPALQLGGSARLTDRRTSRGYALEGPSPCHDGVEAPRNFRGVLLRSAYSNATERHRTAPQVPWRCGAPL